MDFYKSRVRKDLAVRIGESVLHLQSISGTELWPNVREVFKKCEELAASYLTENGDCASLNDVREFRKTLYVDAQVTARQLSKDLLDSLKEAMRSRTDFRVPITFAFKSLKRIEVNYMNADDLVDELDVFMGNWYFSSAPAVYNQVSSVHMSQSSDAISEARMAHETTIKILTAALAEPGNDATARANIAIAIAEAMKAHQATMSALAPQTTSSGGEVSKVVSKPDHGSSARASVPNKTALPATDEIPDFIEETVSFVKRVAELKCAEINANRYHLGWCEKRLNAFQDNNTPPKPDDLHEFKKFCDKSEVAEGNLSKIIEGLSTNLRIINVLLKEKREEYEDFFPTIILLATFAEEILRPHLKRISRDATSQGLEVEQSRVRTSPHRKEGSRRSDQHRGDSPRRDSHRQGASPRRYGSRQQRDPSPIREDPKARWHAFPRSDRR